MADFSPGLADEAGILNEDLPVLSFDLFALLFLARRNSFLNGKKKKKKNGLKKSTGPSTYLGQSLRVSGFGCRRP